MNDRSLVLVPGWATDSRIFKPLRPALPGAHTIDAEPANFAARLLHFMTEENRQKISIMGWSIGGYLAADFALKHPNRVDHLILVGVRKKYPAQQIDLVRRMLNRSPKAYLARFYAECFAEAESEAYQWFKQNLQESYFDTFSRDDLMAGLDYLAQASVNPEALAQIENVTFIHGTKDRIAPIEDIACLSSQLHRHEFVFIEAAGHAVFLNPGFGEWVNSPRREDAPPLSLKNRGEELKTTNSPQSDSTPLSNPKRGAGGECSTPLFLSERGAGGECSTPLFPSERGAGGESGGEL